MPKVPPIAAPAPLAASPAALQALRARAEERRRLLNQATEHHSPQEMQRLVQELQIELEMQYEELLQAQATAERARLEYLDLYDLAPVGYFTLTGSGIIEQLNLAGSRQLGTVRQRLVRRRFALFVHPADQVEFCQFLARVLTTDITVSCELVLQREDGSPFFAQLEGLRGVGALDDVAAPRCRIVVMDITTRRLAADALAASEARFRKLFAQSHDAVVLLQGAMFVDCNAAAMRLLGATRRDQVVGHNFWALAPDLQPDGRRTIDVFRESMAEALQKGTKRCEARMRKISGEEVWMEAVLTPIEEVGSAPLIHVLWRDVTAERLADTRLRESEASLSMALVASETGVFARSLATSMVIMDERAQAAFGWPYTPTPVPLSQVYDCFHPDDAPRVLATIAEAVAAQTTLEVDFRVQWPDGSGHHLSVAGRVVADAQGQPSSLTGVVRDVTVVYATKEELNYKSLVLERLLNNMPLVLARFRPDGTYLEAVGVGLRALGLEDNALVGRSALQEFPALGVHLASVLSGESARFLSEIEVESQSVAFQNFGFFDEQRQQAVVLSVDVTEAEQQKQQLRREKEFTQSLLENSVDGIVALDQTGRITSWNSQATRYFGHQAAAVLGRSLFAVLPQFDNDAARQVIARVLAGEPALQRGQIFPHRAGHFDVYHVPLRHTHEVAPTGVLIMFRDVTERDHLAEETTRLRLRRQQEVLAAILDTQETERKRIAEALHNGLGQLLYATKLSLEGRSGEAAPTGPARESLRLLEEAIRSTRTISFELTPGILEDFGLRIALEELVKRIAPAGLPVRLHLTGLERRLRPAVEITVYRVVQELLNNVMKHAAATEVMVHVTREHGHVEVSVEDNGRGFEAAALATQPLAGIGLAGVRNRVALLGGTLAIHSRLGRGTIISFELNE